jgi:hypothetical protein
MSKIQVQTEIDTRTFLLGAAGLQLNELERLVGELNILIARKKSARNDGRERQLLHLINQTALESDQRARYLALVEKLEDDTMSEEEHREYMVLVERDEQLRNDRVQYLVELAQLRDVSLPRLMENLGLNPPVYG